jgi:hypothetical protein
MSQGGALDTSGGVVPPDVPITFQGNTGTATADMNVLNIIGTGGVVVTGDNSNTLTISISSDFTWNVVTSANNPVTIANLNGYIAKGASPVQFILPASSVIGDTFQIKGLTNLWTLAQNAGQTIALGYVTTTAGVGGSMAATQVKDGLEILCVTANTEFEVLDCIGNPTII